MTNPVTEQELKDIAARLYEFHDEIEFGYYMNSSKWDTNETLAQANKFLAYAQELAIEIANRFDPME